MDMESYFAPLSQEDKEERCETAQSRSFLREAAWRFARDRLAMTGLVVLCVILLFTVFAPMLSPYAYDQQDVASTNLPPSAAHPFGTDKFGRDLFVRVWSGARISLSVGFACALITLVIGVLYGGVSGYIGGNVDLVMMRLLDIIYSVPSLIYVILIMLIFGSNIKSVILGISISCWIQMARIVRGEVMKLKHSEFAMAARLMGAGHIRILFTSLILNALGPIIVNVNLMIPQAIFTEAFLSFVGIGISAPVASWGTLAQDARSQIELYPSQMLFPLLAITITIFAINFIGDGLEKAFRPRSATQLEK